MCQLIFIRCTRIIGENNNVIFKCSEETQGKIELVIQGNGNSVVIEEFVEVTSLLRICIMDNNSKVIIGRGTTIESASISVADDDNFVIIGEDCMFAQNVTLLASDFHTICNLEEGRRINVRKGNKIDNHVWLGIGVTVLKNTRVMSNSICRAASTIGGVIVPPNTIYPERKRKKKEVTWERARKESIVPMEKPFFLKKKIEIQQDSNEEISFIFSINGKDNTKEDTLPTIKMPTKMVLTIDTFLKFLLSLSIGIIKYKIASPL